MRLYRQYRILLTLLVGCCSLVASAQRFTFSILPTQGLLPSANVHALWQDTEGYLWYATERSGLCRDNGYQIDVFRPSDAGGDAFTNRVYCVTETPEGDILAGTYSGMFGVSKRDYTMRKVGLDGQRVEALLTDAKGTTWASMGDKVARLDKQFQIAQTYTIRGAKKHNVVRMFKDSKDRLFSMHYLNGIYVLEPGKTAFRSIKWPLSSWPVQMVEDEVLGCYWVITWGNGIVKCTLDGDSCRIETQEASLGSSDRQNGFDLIRDNRQGLLWASTADNLYAYRVVNGQLQSVPTDHFLPSGHKMIDRLLTTRNGNLYVAGFSPHTFIISPQTDKPTRITFEGLEEKTGYSLLAERSVMDDHYIWLWHTRLGVLCYDTETRQWQVSPWQLSYNMQRNRSEGKGLWVSQRNTIFRVFMQGGTMQREPLCEAPSTAYIRRFFDDGQGNLYVVQANELKRYTLADNRWKTMASLAEDIAAMDFDRHFISLLLGSHTVVYVPHNGKLIQDTFKDRFFTAIATSPDGTIWLGCQDGSVCQYHPQEHKLTVSQVKNDAQEAPVRDVMVDDIGHVWIMSDQFVQEYNPSNNALRTIKASDPAINVDYFTCLERVGATTLTLNGMGAICKVESSEWLNRKSSNAKPVVSSYWIDGVKHYVGAQTEEITLRPEQLDLRLYLTTNEQDVARDIVFAYRLEGLNADWVYLPVGDNAVHFGKLASGTYQLHVKATDRYGCWDEGRMVLRIVSLKPWYKRWWAYLIYIGVILLSVWGVWRIEHRIQRLHYLMERRDDVRLDEIELRREDVTSTRLDDEFLKSLVRHVEAHLADGDYNVEMLSADMCMSRMNLYRKLRSLTEQTPTDFIRDIRLKKAAQLFLDNPDATIVDVAKKVGFSTPQYLSKCFKAKFGVMPKEYARQHAQASAPAPEA